MACDFNTKLFKKFTSMKKEIEPRLANDWTLIPTYYNRVQGIGLESIKTNQKIQDIDVRYFLKLCVEKKITIKANKLEGKYIIGSDRRLYNKEEYDNWIKEINIRTSTIISNKDLKEGYMYETLCGSKIVYLGARYIISISKSNEGLPSEGYPKFYGVINKKNKDDIKLTKCMKKNLYTEVYSDQKMVCRVKSTPKKVKKELTQFIKPTDCDNILENYFMGNKEIVYCDKKSTKNIKLIIKEYPLVPAFSFDSLKYWYSPNVYIKNNNNYDNVYYECSSYDVNWCERVYKLPYSQSNLSKMYKLEIEKKDEKNEILQSIK